MEGLKELTVWWRGERRTGDRPWPEIGALPAEPRDVIKQARGESERRAQRGAGGERAWGADLRSLARLP